MNDILSSYGMINKVLLAAGALSSEKIDMNQICYLISVKDYDTQSIKNINNLRYNVDQVKESCFFLVVYGFFKVSNGCFYKTINVDAYIDTISGVSIRYYEELKGILKKYPDLKQTYIGLSNQYMTNFKKMVGGLK